MPQVPEQMHVTHTLAMSLIYKNSNAHIYVKIIATTSKMGISMLDTYFHGSRAVLEYYHFVIPQKHTQLFGTCSLSDLQWV